MDAGRAYIIVSFLALIACRKDEGSPEEAPPAPIPSAISFERNVPGSMDDASWGPDGTCLALMWPGVYYTSWQLVKIDPVGNVVSGFTPSWPVSTTQRFACATDDGGCMSIATHNDHLVVARMDASGVVVNSRNYAFPGFDRPRRIARTGTDVWVVSGYHQYSEVIDSVYYMRQDVWAMAFDGNADSLWKRDYHDDHHRWPMSSVGLANGDLLITSYYGLGSNSYGNAIRIDPQGGLVWSHDIGLAISYGLGACETASGDILVAGSRVTGPLSCVGALYAITASGAPLWQSTYGMESANVWPTDVAVDEADNIVVVGRYTDPVNSDRRLYVAGFDGAGTVAWERYAANNDTLSEGQRVMADTPGHFRLVGTGYPRPNGTVYPFTFLKGVNAQGVFD